MSKEFPTVNETIAYDDGFADAKDYWTAKEQERIIRLLEEEKESSICDESCYCLPCNLGETEIARKQFESLIALIKGEK